jgi:hypothetical protein
MAVLQPSGGCGLQNNTRVAALTGPEVPCRATFGSVLERMRQASSPVLTLATDLTSGELQLPALVPEGLTDAILRPASQPGARPSAGGAIPVVS